MTTVEGAVFLGSESPTVTRARTFFLYAKALYAANDQPMTPQAEARFKAFIWRSVQEGANPALLPDTTTYTREEAPDAD